MKRCYDIRHCPASCYLSCKAYSRGSNCWDTVDIPCCKRDNKSRCKSCRVYEVAQEDEEDEREI